MTTVDLEHPYSAAIVVGDLIFVSGALSVDAAGRLVTGRRPALDAALEMLSRRLATVDAHLPDVVKLTYYVTDISLRDEANAQFAACFADPRPARTFLEVTRLPYGATVEIDAIARRSPAATA